MSVVEGGVGGKGQDDDDAKKQRRRGPPWRNIIGNLLIPFR